MNPCGEDYVEGKYEELLAKVDVLESQNRELSEQLQTLLDRFNERTALIPELEAKLHAADELAKAVNDHIQGITGYYELECQIEAYEKARGR